MPTERKEFSFLGLFQNLKKIFFAPYFTFIFESMNVNCMPRTLRHCTAYQEEIQNYIHVLKEFMVYSSFCCSLIYTQAAQAVDTLQTLFPFSCFGLSRSVSGIICSLCHHILLLLFPPFSPSFIYLKHISFYDPCVPQGYVLDILLLDNKRSVLVSFTMMVSMVTAYAHYL